MSDSSSAPPFGRPPTPLFLVAGFLGAGKTTLLRRLLPLVVDRGLRPHVILNDYQDARIDAASLRQFTEDVRPVSGTCVCCDSQDELLRQLASMELGPRSVLLVEVNGTADTTEVIEILTAERRASRYTLPTQIGVIDGSRWQRRGRNDELERLQAQSSTYLHLTRTEDLGPPNQERLRASTTKVAPRARFAGLNDLAETIEGLLARSASLPPRRFAAREGTDPEASLAPHQVRGRDHVKAHHFSSVEVRLPRPVRREQLVQILRSHPAEVLRVKGIARLRDCEETVYFERTDRPDAVSVYPLPGATGLDSVAILIGVGLDPIELTQALDPL